MEGIISDIQETKESITKVKQDIDDVKKEIIHIQTLLAKEHHLWTRQEKLMFGDYSELREKENCLREVLKQLREKENKLKEQRNNQSENHNMDIHSSEFVKLTEGTSQTSTIPPKKFLTCAGPVSSKIHFTIPLDSLSWGKELIEAVDGEQAILLHGHWQSGKTSALHFIRSRAEAAGIDVYYIDMMKESDALKQTLNSGYSIYQFLAWHISRISLDLLPKYTTTQFCYWIQSIHKNRLRPILLIDEYDAFLHVCRNDQRILIAMNRLIAYSRNEMKTFTSIVCAGTFSIVATQYSSVNDMYFEDDADSQQRKSDDSLDAVMRFFEAATPWNEALVIETQPFERQVFQDFAKKAYKIHNVNVVDDIIDDIFETTCGHPGLSIWLLIQSVKHAIARQLLIITIWMDFKRKILANLYQTPKMVEMVNRVKSFKKIEKFENILHILIRDNQVKCVESRMASFLRSVGIAKRFYQADVLTFTSPIIRDCLLQEFYPKCDTISEITELCHLTPVDYMQTVLLKTLPFIKAEEMLDPVVSCSKGLSEATMHAELYRILHSLFCNQNGTILTGTRIVSSSEDRRIRCDIWIKTSFSEFGIELKTECDNSFIQKEANALFVKYASTRKPREIVLLNFVMKEAKSITFPINVLPTGWDLHKNINFSVLFVKVMGDARNGLKFSYATHGSSCWLDL